MEQSHSTAYSKKWRLDLGACVLGDGRTKFNIWAPYVNDMQVLVLKDGSQSKVKMEKNDPSYFTKTISVEAGTRYFYVLDNKKKRADPASRFQPEGVHGPSEVVDDTSFKWTDTDWGGIRMENLIIYEIHVGTCTRKGDFDSLTHYIRYLTQELGITAIELMPLAQFPGDRNWGYDGVFMFAPQNSYGGPQALKELVNACHNMGLAVILDVVYNHVGPEGNYLADFGPYFSRKYSTPWGPSMNYDDRGSDNVRRFVISNALYWITEYHFDGLRLDAIHGIFDLSPMNILQEMKGAVENQAKELKREISVIAESDLNDPRIVRPLDECGYGLDGQWSDDFHHSVHAYLTGERFGYYQDFGSLEDIQKSLTSGFVYDGKYSVFRGKKHGQSSKGIPGKQFVVCLQNHDQIGNRPDGLRVSCILDPSALKLAAALLILSPYVPLLFMGEEYGEKSPFYYFTSHSDPALIKAVREGRKREFEGHHLEKEFVDPQDKVTFDKSKVDLDLWMKPGINQELFSYYKELIGFRKSHPALSSLAEDIVRAKCSPEWNTLTILRSHLGRDELLLIFNLGSKKSQIDRAVEYGTWKKIHDSNSSQKQNLPQSAPAQIYPRASFSLPPFTVVVYSRMDG